MTITKSVVAFICSVKVIFALSVNGDSMEVEFFDMLAFNVNGTAVYKNGVLLFPIFLLSSSKL